MQSWLIITYRENIFSRFEETNELSNDCKQGENCIGGYARLVTMVNYLKNTTVNPIYLNAGDNFQGTLWYFN